MTHQRIDDKDCHKKLVMKWVYKKIVGTVPIFLKNWSGTLYRTVTTTILTQSEVGVWLVSWFSCISYNSCRLSIKILDLMLLPPTLHTRASK